MNRRFHTSPPVTGPNARSKKTSQVLAAPASLLTPVFLAVGLPLRGHALRGQALMGNDCVFDTSES